MWTQGLNEKYKISRSIGFSQMNDNQRLLWEREKNILLEDQEIFL